MLHELFFLKSLHLNPHHLVIVGITVMVKTSVLMVWHYARKTKFHYQHTNLGIRLGHALNAFSNFCDLHYRHVTNMLQHYIPRKGNEFDGQALISNSGQVLKDVSVLSFYRDYQSLLERKEAPRITTVLVDEYYGLWQQHNNITALMDTGIREYDACLKEFNENIRELSHLYDELKEYVKGKNLNQSSGQWVQGYFSIFDQWLHNGGKKDPDILQPEIVVKIQELNRSQAGSPFIGKTNEKAWRCTQAYQMIVGLDNTISTALGDYGRAWKKAGKLTGLMAQRLVPGNEQGPLFANMPSMVLPKKFSRRQWVMICSGVVLLAVICFLGGVYISTEEEQAHPVKQVSDTTHLKEGTHTGAPNKPAPLIKGLDTVHTVYGLDISKYQGNLLKDLGQMDTLHFVICKATEGKTIVDPDFKSNWKQLQEKKIIRGAYHFYSDLDDPVQQAQHFLRTVGPLDTMDIPLVLDIEDGSIHHKGNGPQLSQALISFLQYIEQQTGSKPVIYTSLAFADNYLTEEIFAGYPLWLAEYSKRPAPRLPSTWKKKGHTFWQKGDTLTIDSHKTDFDVFNGSGRSFLQFLHQKGQ